MKQKQDISNAFKKLVLPGLFVVYVIFLMACTYGCGSNNLNSDDNKQLLEGHILFSLDLKSNNLPKHVEGSWLAVQPYYDENNDMHWSIIGSSESSLDESILSEIDILVIIHSAQSSAQYRSTEGKVSTGTSEYATLCYYDAHTGDRYGEEMLSAGALPSNTTSTPNYTIPDRKIRKTIEKRINSQIDPDYDTDAFVMDDTVLQSVNLEYEVIVAIPEYITEISAEAGDDFKRKKNLSVIELPENIEKINLPDMHDKVTLGVYEGSYAEQYSIEHGYLYYHLGTQDAYLPEGVYEYDRVHYTNERYGYLHIPSSVSYIRNGVFSTNSAVFVVNEGSYAEQAAKESKHIYCYEGQQEYVHIPEGADFFIPEKVVELTAIIHLPSNVYITDQMDDFLTENAAHLTFVAPKGSYAESYAQEKGIPIIFE